MPDRAHRPITRVAICTARPSRCPECRGALDQGEVTYTCFDGGEETIRVRYCQPCETVFDYPDGRPGL